MNFKFLLPVFILIFASCKKNSTSATTSQSTLDQQAITKYISDHTLTAQSTSDGLYYVIEQPGNSVRPLSTSTVVVKYKGYLTNGTVFDQSPDAGTEIYLGTAIKGWQEGIPLFKKGGVGKLLIPSALGYGTSGATGIPANSVLIFDITLLNVKY